MSLFSSQNIWRRKCGAVTSLQQQRRLPGLAAADGWRAAPRLPPDRQDCMALGRHRKPFYSIIIFLPLSYSGQGPVTSTRRLQEWLQLLLPTLPGMAHWTFSLWNRTQYFQWISLFLVSQYVTKPPQLRLFYEG